jgi:hypothetical protein
MPTARNAPVDRGHGFPDEEDYRQGDYGTADSMLGPSVPYISFTEPGDQVTGVIVDISDPVPQTDPDGSVPLWDDGTPRTQIIITLETDQAADEDDDGTRRLFVKGGGMVKAFRAEMRRAKVRGPRVGGELTVVYTGDGEVTRKGFNAPKVYAVAYTPPAN